MVEFQKWYNNRIQMKSCGANMLEMKFGISFVFLYAVFVFGVQNFKNFVQFA